jgi:nucleoside 2-deoxyribosyltransferase
MPTCFVIQPFDQGKFDKRYRQTFSPAIIAAGLTPYRVDEDAGVEVPIEAIEKGIQGATICLADITTDNPNVWYELGYAMAIGRQVVMICSTEREERYPSIFSTGASSDTRSRLPRTTWTFRRKSPRKLKCSCKSEKPSRKSRARNRSPQWLASPNPR